MTPIKIAQSIQSALEAPEVERRPQVHERLQEALDAVADGMPGEHVGGLLYRALEQLLRA